MYTQAEREGKLGRVDDDWGPGRVIDQRNGPVWIDRRFITDGFAATVGPLATAVYVTIVALAGVDASVSLPADAIARTAGVSLSTVKRSVRELEDAWLLRIERTVTVDGGAGPNRYTLLNPFNDRR